MVAWHRPAEVVALSFVTAIFVEQIHRRPVLDSLGDDLQTEVVGEVDDGPDVMASSLTEHIVVTNDLSALISTTGSRWR